MESDKQLLTIKEMVELLDLSTGTVERKIKDGIMPALRLTDGRRIYVKRSGLLATLEPVKPEDVHDDDGDECAPFSAPHRPGGRRHVGHWPGYAKRWYRGGIVRGSRPGAGGMEDMMTETYSELISRHAWRPCSCCGESAYIGSALVTTDDDDLVKWVLCKKCEGYCDRLENRAGQLDCPFDPCKEDAKYTRLWQKQYERWRKEMGDG